MAESSAELFCWGIIQMDDQRTLSVRSRCTEEAQPDPSARVSTRRSRNYVRLSHAQAARIGADLAQSPETFGYARTSWSGVLLSTHLRKHHGISLSERQ